MAVMTMKDSADLPDTLMEQFLDCGFNITIDQPGRIYGLIFVLFFAPSPLATRNLFLNRFPGFCF